LMQDVGSTTGTRGHHTLRTPAQDAATTPSPVPRAEPAFDACLGPHRSTPTRGPKGTRGAHGVLTRSRWGLSTGMPWKGWPIPTDAEGPPALHAPTGDSTLARGAADGARQQACTARGGPLAAETRLDRRGLHGDGTNPVAQQGARGLAPPARRPTRARRFWRAPTVMAMACLDSQWRQGLPRRWGCGPKG
jgi:hypothetical protein